MHLEVLHPCDPLWEAMRGDALTRRCSACDKPVHDLSARSEAQALGMLALFGSGGLCVRFETDEDGAVRHAPPGPRRVALAAGIVAAAMATGCDPPRPAVVAPVQAPVVAEAPGPEPTPVSAEPAPAPTASASAPEACSPGLVQGDAGVCEPPRRVRVITTGELVVIPHVQFAYGSSRVLPVSEALLDEVARLMRDYSGIRKVAVVGHTSSDEAPGAHLGKARARAVIAALAKRQVATERLVEEDDGGEHYIADNATVEGRKKNRRVDFRVLEQRRSGLAPAP